MTIEEKVKIFVSHIENTVEKVFQKKEREK